MRRGPKVDERIRPIVEALRLREWVISGSRDAAPAASEVGWDIFLRSERCAAWLLVRGAAEHPRIHARALVEWQRILSARAQLSLVAAWAMETGRRVAVLKGGVGVLRGAPLDLMDVDLLGSPAAPLADFLDSIGYDRLDHPAAARLANRGQPNAVQIEVHAEVPAMLQSGTPVEEWAPSALPGLSMLHPRHHLWHVLHHSTVQHADRRGRIRDLLLVADAYTICDGHARTWTTEQMAGAKQAEVLRMQLTLARSLADGSPGVDPFMMIAATNYALAEWRLRRGPGPLRTVWITRSAITLGARLTGHPANIGGSTLAIPSAYPALAALRRVAPPVERLVRIGLRRGPALGVRPFANRIVQRAAAALAACREAR